MGAADEEKGRGYYSDTTSHLHGEGEGPRVKQEKKGMLVYHWILFCPEVSPGKGRGNSTLTFQCAGKKTVGGERGEKSIFDWPKAMRTEK